MIEQDDKRIEDDFGWLEFAERSCDEARQEVASRWGLKRGREYRPDFHEWSAVVDSLTENELEWLAKAPAESYADCQKRTNFFRHKTQLLRARRRLAELGGRA